MKFDELAIIVNCPNCKSKDLKYESYLVNASDGYIWYEVTCENCGTMWDENYTFQFCNNDNLYIPKED